MLFSVIMERIPEDTALHNMANHLADYTRDIWIEKQNSGAKKWEVTFYEEPTNVAFLREEGFTDLIGIDYIFKWWGAADVEESAGELEVLWKVRRENGVYIFKTWVRFADRDFIRGNIRDEERKREMNRQEFVEAMEHWKTCYREAVAGVI